MAVQNPNNWHWVDKNCLAWAREYLRQQLVGLSTGADPESPQYARVSSVSSIDGDCEVSQRKGKVISLFELQVVVLLEGHVGDESFSGSITVPEVAFDTERDEYQFDVSVYKETSGLSAIKPVVREKLVPQMRDVFAAFGPHLLAEHGQDIQVPEAQVQSAFTKENQQAGVKATPTAASAAATKTASAPAPAPAPVATATATPSARAPSARAPSANRSTLHLEPAFIVPASEIYTTFVDKQRVQAFTRGPVRVTGTSSGNASAPQLQVGDSFELFEGNVCSELVAADPGRALEFRWRLREWPAKVWSTLHMAFHESNEFHETKVQVTWSGIPVGEEDRVRANFENFYVRPIKLTFGFGVVL